MNPLVIAGGVILAAKVVAFIFDQLTDDEKALQQELQNHETIAQQAQARAQGAHDQERSSAVCEEMGTYRDYLTETLIRRIENETELRAEISNSIKTVRELLNGKEITTVLRRRSLERLVNQLYEAKERCFGYTKYLEQYKRELDRTDREAFIPAFSMRIPADYPYIGKVLWLCAGDMKDGHCLEQRVADDLLWVRYKCVDDDLLDFDEDSELPFMAESFDSHFFGFELSLAKGQFHVDALENTRIGVNALVKEIQQDGIVLQYHNTVNLFLKNGLLKKPYRKPLVRSKMVVYPVNWTYGLAPYFKTKNVETSCSVFVSEFQNDSTASLRFDSIPILFSPEQWTQIDEYMTDNHIYEVDDEWKIGPADEEQLEITDGTVMKLQFGDCLVIRAALKSVYFGDGRQSYILQFQQLLSTGESFKSDDIFVDLEVDMAVVVEALIENIKNHLSYDELNLFVMDIFSELCLQKQIKASRAGARYYQRWADTNQKLISYLNKGREFTAEIGDVERDKDNLKLRVKNADELRKKVETYYEELARQGGNEHRLKPEFLFEDVSQEQYTVHFSGDFSTITIYNGGKHIQDDFSTGSVIMIYAKVFPYAEIQQSVALNRLRLGGLANPIIQAAMMDGANVRSNAEPLPALDLCNRAIQTDVPQFEALTRALAEKDIFLIQGPPGTGKTTVIRELVEQSLRRDPRCRVLIVSQANVAVDNALSGVCRTHAGQVVRCGNPGRISEELQALTLDERYSKYIDHIQSGSPKGVIFDKWMELVNPESGINPNVGELIIRAHQITGATCVGLAKKRIGLERVEFDLVIIDEASKALPGEILIPVLRAKKLVMIGDHRQLPPVINPVLYDPAKIELEDRDIVFQDLFEKSLFERLYERVPDSNKAMLRTQYRMPSVIGSLVSDLFYNGELNNGKGTDEKLPIFSRNSLVFYDFSDDAEYKEFKKDNTICNEREAIFVIGLLLDIESKAPGHSVAVITPYRGQKRLIEKMRLGSSDRLGGANIRINTIDAFQGDEAEIVIYCSTRAQRRTKYFSDYKRINVALSRAENELIILGKLSYFERYDEKSSPLPTIAAYVKEHGQVIQVDPKVYAQRQQNMRDDTVPLSSIHVKDEVDPAIMGKEVSRYVRTYIETGQMSSPILVKRVEDEFVVSGNVAVYYAALKLDLSECWIRQSEG